MATRTFDSGAYRDTNDSKIDIEGHINPISLKVYLEYMHKHRFLENGNVRDSDNWQKGIPFDVYVKSLLRHTLDVWLINRGFDGEESVEDALCGVIFNAMGMLYEIEKEKDNV